ncbi:serine hydrolase domain-containing protein [Marinilactibacillus sp. GCM10026970]|uniref:serine hydrolase domain-containing protein n=1 Tax=Marinilactibacillus sp. GCM10026970 TaxID=3252642 RepID=UPI00360E36E4
MNTQLIVEQLNAKQEELGFFGNIRVIQNGECIISRQYGYANMAEKIPNKAYTRFGIASGCKIFTAISICQLVEQGKLTFDTKLRDCLSIDFPHFDPSITVHHLLTHTSGVPDYFDEDVMDDFEELWIDRPMYHIRNLKDFLPMFQYEKMVDKVGSDFNYNNTGYVLLGLIIEAVSGMIFSDYVEKHVFEVAGMNDSGYFSLDKLQANVATGYVEEEDGTWKSNIFSIPAKGGSDGGAYVSVEDMERFWKALMNHQLLTKTMTDTLLKPQVHEEDDFYYGYGGFMKVNDQEVIKYAQLGYDPGVNYHSVYYPNENLSIIVCSNKSSGAFDLQYIVEQALLNQE